MITLEFKTPRIMVEPTTYGEYLMRNPDRIPEVQIGLETLGYLVCETDYGEAKQTELPFLKGDWIEKEYADKNFRVIAGRI